MSYTNPRLTNDVINALLGDNAAWNQLVMNSTLPLVGTTAGNAAAANDWWVGPWDNHSDPNATTPMSLPGLPGEPELPAGTGYDMPYDTPVSIPPEYPEPELPAGGGSAPSTPSTPSFPNINLPDIPSFDFDFGQGPGASMPDTDFSLTNPSMGNFGFVDVNSHAAGAGRPMEIPSGSLLPVEIMKSIDRKHPLEAALS